MARLSALDLMSMVSDIVSNVDQDGVLARVSELREEHPERSVQELVNLLIKRKSKQAGAVGAATAGAALIPGVGTLFVLAAGTVADIAVVLRMQAELVLEIAAAHQRLLTEDERQRAILLVTGLSAGTNQLAVSTGRKVSLGLGERFAEKWVVKVLPVVGIAVSAGVNALSTYIVGTRAHAYFSLGPDQMKDWRESLRTITGVDERKVGQRLHESAALHSGRQVARTVGIGAGKVAGALGKTGSAIADRLARNARRRKKSIEL